jgi:hypothetical protein
MLPAQAEPELVTRLTAAGLAPESLDPWEAWKVFKRYLHAEVDGVYDAAAFQCGRFPDDGSDTESFYATFVRQFSRWEGGRDEPVRRVVLELRYGVGDIRPDLAREVWTHDFPTLEEFASVVEGLPQFQSAMSVRPKHTAVYGEEL